MNEFIEKLIDKIENEAFAVQLEKGIKHPSTLDAMMEKFSVFRIKEIVNQLAEEYNNEAVKGDLISKKAVITELNGIYLDNPWDNKEDILEKAIGIVDHFPTSYNNGWIPYSERLPKELKTKDGHIDPSEEVLVYIYYGKNCVSNGYAVSRYWSHSENHPNPWIDLKFGSENVIAWKPIEPYQPKGE